SPCPPPESELYPPMPFSPLPGPPLHADALAPVPPSYPPTGGLVDSLAASVDDPSPRRAVRRGDHFPLPPLVGEAGANPKFPRGGLVFGCWFFFALLWRARPCHARPGLAGQIQPPNEKVQKRQKLIRPPTLQF